MSIKLRIINVSYSFQQLDNLMRKLEKQPGMLRKYDDIIQDQLRQGIVERALKEKCSTFRTKPLCERHRRALRSTSSTMDLPEAENQHSPLTSV